jgi:gamma-glutamyltranspeptidase / glutathione hydrolase
MADRETSGRVDHWRIAKPTLVTESGAVTAQHWLSARIGARVLAAGGNAVDAAVATALSLQVTEPWMSGLGASGFALYQKPADLTADVVDFRGVTAVGLDPGIYMLEGKARFDHRGQPRVVNALNSRGAHSICVPGSVSGLALLLREHGTWGWDHVLAPAIDLAERGLPLDWHATLAIALDSKRSPPIRQRHPSTSPMVSLHNQQVACR